MPMTGKKLKVSESTWSAERLASGSKLIATTREQTNLKKEGGQRPPSRESHRPWGFHLWSSMTVSVE